MWWWCYRVSSVLLLTTSLSKVFQVVVIYWERNAELLMCWIASLFIFFHYFWSYHWSHSLRDVLDQHCWICSDIWTLQWVALKVSFVHYPGPWAVVCSYGFESLESYLLLFFVPSFILSMTLHMCGDQNLAAYSRCGRKMELLSWRTELLALVVEVVSDES